VITTTDYELYNTTIQCAADQPCHVYCTALHACTWATVVCPTDGASACELFCDTASSPCQHVTVEAASSGPLLVRGDSSYAFRYSTVVAPPSAVDLLCGGSCAWLRAHVP